MAIREVRPRRHGRDACDRGPVPPVTSQRLGSSGLCGGARIRESLRATSKARESPARESLRADAGSSARARARRVLAELARLGSRKNVEGMARFGIVGDDPFGVSIPVLRRIAKREGRSHALAAALWKSGRHEARILAAFVDEPSRVTPAQMDRGVRDFRSWDVCDQVCGNLFDRTAFADAKAKEWARRTPEFEKRAGFALMAMVAAHDKSASDARLLAFLPFIERAADDDRNFVKKAVSWALRTIGKRGMSHSPRLHRASVASARRIDERASRAARWIARDVLAELAPTAVSASRRSRSGRAGPS
ncbi:MAG: DNA alkylation repair protein [Thermoplasmatota archaeon]